MTLYDNQGVTYVFGFKNVDGDWQLVPHRFILSGLDSKLAGQFITSNWFSHKLRMSEQIPDQRYIILGINRGFKYSDVTRALNNTCQSFSDMGISFMDEYILTSTEITNTYESLDDMKSINIEIKGIYEKSIMTLSGTKISSKKGLYVSLPDFAML
jgi:hypothetical protein